MLWRLFVTILAVSDTGAPSISQDHSDWPTEQRCTAAVEQLYAIKSDTVRMHNHEIQVRIEATCVPVLRSDPPVSMTR